MTRIGLCIALAIGAITGLVFGLRPEFDLQISSWFYEAGTGFPATANQWLQVLRDASMVLVGLLVAPAVVAPLVKLARPERPLLIPGRAVVFLLGTILLAPLLTANVVLKDNWGRSRPSYIEVFEGLEPFLPWWDPRGHCRDNCSFIGGESSGAFWTIAPAALAPPQWRPLAYAAAITFGSAVSVLRIAFGGHFFTDVVFAGVITFTIIWLMHGLIYRWRPRITDARIEQLLARFAHAIRRPFRRTPGAAAGGRRKAGPD